MQLEELEAVLADRHARLQAHGADDEALAESYSATLLADSEAAQRKIVEEAFELCLELGRAQGDRQRIAHEAADVVFHVLTGLVGAGVSVAEVLAELEARRPGADGGGQTTRAVDAGSER
jgi:phosphoribosyl-ATP pyrophosphohydrolase